MNKLKECPEKRCKYYDSSKPKKCKNKYVRMMMDDCAILENFKKQDEKNK